MLVYSFQHVDVNQAVSFITAERVLCIINQCFYVVQAVFVFGTFTIGLTGKEDGERSIFAGLETALTINLNTSLIFLKMKNAISVLLMVAFGAIMNGCNTDNPDVGSLNCADLTDDLIIIDGKAFPWHAAGTYNCGQTPINGAVWVSHLRDVIYGSGSTLIIPAINITLSSVPPAGQTTTYQLDNGMWQISSNPAPAGLATFRMNFYEETPDNQSSWFSDSDSGTVQATADANGNVTLNFSDVQLVMNGGLLTNRKSICGKNLICH